MVSLIHASPTLPSVIDDAVQNSAIKAGRLHDKNGRTATSSRACSPPFGRRPVAYLYGVAALAGSDYARRSARKKVM